MRDSTTFAEPQEAEKRARAIVKAATHFNDPKVSFEVSEDLAGATLPAIVKQNVDKQTGHSVGLKNVPLLKVDAVMK